MNDVEVWFTHNSYLIIHRCLYNCRIKMGLEGQGWRSEQRVAYELENIDVSRL